LDNLEKNINWGNASNRKDPKYPSPKSLIEIPWLTRSACAELQRQGQKPLPGFRSIQFPSIADQVWFGPMKVLFIHLNFIWQIDMPRDWTRFPYNYRWHAAKLYWVSDVK
jgi:hypothetical protein